MMRTSDRVGEELVLLFVGLPAPRDRDSEGLVFHFWQRGKEKTLMQIWLRRLVRVLVLVSERCS